MATKLANALRTQAAIDRIVAAMQGELALPIHRDPDIERVLRYEAIADALEARGGKASAKPASTTEAVAQVEAELEAETGKDFVKTTESPPVLAETSKPKGKSK